MAVIAQASFGVPSRKSILQKQEKYVLFFLNSLINNMRVRRQSYLLFCLSVSYSFRCDDDSSQYQDQEWQEGQ